MIGCTGCWPRKFFGLGVFGFSAFPSSPAGVREGSALAGEVFYSASDQALCRVVNLIEPPNLPNCVGGPTPPAAAPRVAERPRRRC